MLSTMSIPGRADLAPTDAAARLMEAAADAFAAKGFHHATTTRDIAGRAGLSPAGVTTSTSRPRRTCSSS